MTRKTAYRSGQHSLSESEYNKVLRACANQEDRVMILLAVALGLRRSDIVRIRWPDVDLEGSEIRYREKKKGDRIRIVPIGPRLVQELRILRAAQPRNQDRVLSFKDRQAYNRFQKICEIAGIPRRPFHALRATAIKRMQAAGWSPEAVAEIVGDSIRTIQEHYLSPSRGELAEAAQEKEVI